MNRQQALQTLNLTENDSPEAVRQALVDLRASIQQKRDLAPTDALKTKFENRLAQLNDIEACLLQKPHTPNSPAQEPQPMSEAIPKPSSPLSQTKLADLPHMEATQTAVELQAGQVLADRYEIKEQIGRGGMGAVYCVFDRTRNKDIALKVLLPEFTQSPRARERFLDEARISSELSHTGIVNVFDVQNDGEQWFITMELLEGQSLRSFMDSHEATGNPIAVDETLEIVQSLCDALAYAHQYTVHRDIKPENIFLTEDGETKLMDFGIARLLSNSQRTQTGAAMGTAYYMAPEQIKGRSNIDGRADQYALAVLIYEMLAGEVPTGRIESLNKVRKDVPAGLSQAINKALSPKPDDRFADIAGFKPALTQKSRANFNLPWKPIGIAAGILVAILGIGGVVSSGSIDLANLMPMSKAEIATHKAELAKLQGEIKNAQRRLDNSRRNLDSEVRDAERNGSDTLKNLTHWQKMTETSLFAGSQLSTLEGNLAAAESLMGADMFDEAKTGLRKVRDGYQHLQKEFDAGQYLLSAKNQSQAQQILWKEQQAKHQLSDSSEATTARQQSQQAQQSEIQGELATALHLWQTSRKNWQTALSQAQPEIERIVTERAAAIEAQAKRAAEQKQQAEYKAQMEQRVAQVKTPIEARAFLREFPSGTYAEKIKNKDYWLMETSIFSNSNDNSNRTHRYQYNDLGQLTKMVSQTEGAHPTTTIYQYNDLDQLVKKVRQTDGGKTTTIYQYDELSQLTKEESQTDEEKPTTITYQYDNAGNKTLKQNAGAYEERYQYDTHGRMTEKKYNSYNTNYWTDTRYHYNQHGDIDSEIETTSTGRNHGYKEVHTYNNSHQLIRTFFSWKQGGYTKTNEFKYDNTGKVAQRRYIRTSDGTEVVQNIQITYTYNRNGTLKTETETGFYLAAYFNSSYKDGDDTRLPIHTVTEYKHIKHKLTDSEN